MLPGFLRSVRAFLSFLLILATSAGIIGTTWYFVRRGIAVERQDALDRADATVTALAASYSEQINRQILALDQTLDTMVRDYEADPRHFNLESARQRAPMLTGISRDMFLTDENGVIRQSSVPDFVGRGAAELDAFREAAEHSNDKPTMFLGGASVNPIMRQWHLDAARTLHHPDGSFAGIIDADYRIAAITGIFSAASPPGNGFAGLVDLTGGKLRVALGAAGNTPDANISDTKMFAALDAGDAGLWTGPSASDAV